jgi:predicted nucleic acid-binding protein
MAEKHILIDTSILIEYYRKTDKSNSKWVALIRSGYDFSVSAVTRFEIYSGATASQIGFWETIFKSVNVLPFDADTADVAAKINAQLKRKRKQIDIADLFIAAAALKYKLPLATLNVKHFERIERLQLI